MRRAGARAWQPHSPLLGQARPLALVRGLVLVQVLVLVLVQGRLPVARPRVRPPGRRLLRTRQVLQMRQVLQPQLGLLPTSKPKNLALPCHRWQPSLL